nr:protein enabled-like [Aegilops tauschii subsp. strangulata]
MKIQVALDEAGKAKPVPPPKPAGEGSRRQHNQQNNKRKADQPAQRYDNRLVAAAEQAPAAEPATKRWNTGKTTWQPTMSFEEMLDAPCKHHSGARPSTHTLRSCAITKRIARGDIPPPPALAPGARQPPPPPPLAGGAMRDDPYPAQKAT